MFLQTQGQTLGYTPAPPFSNPRLWSQAESTTSIPWIYSLPLEDFSAFKTLSTKFHNKDVHLPIDIDKCTSAHALCYILLGAIQNYLVILASSLQSLSLALKHLNVNALFYSFLEEQLI